ncbi:diaminopimelate epimerase [Chloroflexota bacterium]
MNFTKMQGAGNDFIMIETSDVQRDWPAVAIAMCERHYGVGADSLILILPSDKADFKMRTFDADGSEAETCGNGIRCLAKYFFEEGRISENTERIKVEIVAGVRELKLHKQYGKVVSIQAAMGSPTFGAEGIPAKIGSKIVDIMAMMNYSVNVSGIDLQLNLVSMGNPHAVYFSPDPVAEFPLSQLGPKVENLNIFPNRTNFEVARILSREQIEVRTWERGVGETLACGSGSCAVTVAARLYSYIDNKVEIKLLGGTLGVEWDGVGEVLMSGPAEKVFIGEWPEEV